MGCTHGLRRQWLVAKAANDTRTHCQRERYADTRPTVQPRTVCKKQPALLLRETRLTAQEILKRMSGNISEYRGRVRRRMSASYSDLFLYTSSFSGQENARNW